MNNQECKHHWLIQEAQSKFSWGICQNCNLTREFQNSPDISSEFDAKMRRDAIIASQRRRSINESIIHEASVKDNQRAP
tara:strand:+ start:598 stop:834 length:237 start_codon:yes stop_codon:yes gene_type:complete